MKNIHLVPTEEPSRVFNTNKGEYYFREHYVPDTIQTCKNYNIYITSDEEVKEGDYFLYDETTIRYKTNGTEYHGRDLCHISGNRRYPVSESKKIILTTDQDLIKDGVQAIDDEFLEWFVKNPSCEFVKTELVYDYEEHSELTGNPREEWSYYKIIIPQEEPKQETLEEAAEKWVFETNGHKWSNNDDTAGDNYGSFVEGAKWQAKRMYSEEEVFNFAQNIITEIETRKQNIISNSKNMTTHLLEGGCMAFESSQDVVKELFKQFKKKQ